MESKKIESESSTRAKGEGNRGAAIGGAIGHTIGAVADVVIGAVAGGIAAGKKAGGKDTVAEVVVGVVSGGISAGMNAAGKTAAKPVNPTAEHEFWRKECATRPDCAYGTPYEQYAPAFQYGWESQASHKGKTFKEVEPQLEREWEARRGPSRLNWNQVKSATRDAWQRVEKAACGDDCSS